MKTNADIVRRLVDEVWNDRRFAGADALLVHDYAERDKGWALAVLRAIPDGNSTN